MWPEVGETYVCVSEIKSYVVGSLCTVKSLSAVFDADYYTEDFGTVVFLDGIECSVWLGDFRRCFVPRDEWRRLRFTELEL